MKSTTVALTLTLAFAVLTAAKHASPPYRWPAPKAMAIPQADGYVEIPNASVMPRPSRTYRAIFNATEAADRPSELLPALNNAGSELNILAGTGVPLRNAKFVVVFHGAALPALLDDAHYRVKFGVANPNLDVIREMKKAGVELYVCGQNLAFAHVDPRTLTPDVKVATDALIVLMHYQNDGYAVLEF